MLDSSAENAATPALGATADRPPAHAPLPTLEAMLRGLTVVTLLPLIVFGGLTTWRLVEQERDTFQRGAQERVRALSTAVDAELRSSLTTLQGLTTSEAMLRIDPPALRAQFDRVLRNEHDWATLHVSLPSGEQVVNAREPGTATPLKGGEAAQSLRVLLREKRPTVGPISPGAADGAWQFLLRVPVIEEDEVRHVLTAAVSPAGLQRLLAAQRLPPSWVGAVLDADGTVVARTTNAPSTVGKPASPSLRAAVSASEEGWFQGSTIEGLPVYTAFVRSDLSGWSVAIGIPVQEADAAGREAAGTMLGGTLGALMIALVTAWWWARRIIRPVVTLAHNASALGAGEAPSPAFIGRQAAKRAREIALLEDAVTRAGNEQRRLRAQAEAANRAKDEFLAMLGHELRNPLGAITMASQVLHRAAGADAAQRAHAIIDRQTAHLKRLVDDLLDAGRVSSGKIKLDRRPLNLAELVRRAAGVAAENVSRRRVTLHLEEAWVDGDETRLEQITNNLLSNAIRYSAQDGRIDIGVRSDGEVVKLTVTDDGIGIAPELLPRMFDLFVQGGQDLQRSAGGLGIGLTLVRRLAELHGGSATASSAGEGRGSTFTVCLPRAQPPQIDQPPSSHEALDAKPARQRVLVIDDNEDFRTSTRDVLLLAGHDVIERGDGVAGVQAALEYRPHTALIDIGLPGIDGYETARRIRAGLGRGIRLIALTGYGQPEDRRRSDAAGFDAYETKPIEPDRLMAMAVGEI